MSLRTLFKRLNPVLTARDIGAQIHTPEEIAEIIRTGEIDQSRIPTGFANALSEILYPNSRAVSPQVEMQLGLALE